MIEEGTVAPFRMNGPQLRRAVAAIAAAPLEDSRANVEGLPPGVTLRQAETMANAAQDTWTALRACRPSLLEQWAAETPAGDKQRLLTALVALRRAMK